MNKTTPRRSRTLPPYPASASPGGPRRRIMTRTAALRRLPVLAAWTLGLMSAAFGALATASLAAPHAEAPPSYGVLLKTLGNPYWAALADGARSGAKTAQVAVWIDAAPSDQAEAVQLEACNAMLRRRPAALLAAAIDVSNLLPCLRDAHRQHIPVVDLDDNLDADLDRRQGVRVAFHIGADAAAAGARAAEFVAQKLGGAGASGRVLVIEGLAGNISSRRRADGFAARLQQLSPHLAIVARANADWDRDKAAGLTRDVIARVPDLRAVFACNDTMVLGALEAVRNSSGEARHAVVIGVDGTRDAVQAVRDGRLDATVAQLPYLLGQEAVLHTAEWLAGHPVVRQIEVPTLLVTREVLTSQSSPLLRDLR